MRRFFAVFFFISLTSASACDDEPLSFPITDVQVDPKVADSFIKGIPAQIGNPPQNIVLMPWP